MTSMPPDHPAGCDPPVLGARRALVLMARVAVTTALLWLIFTRIDPRSVWHSLESISWPHLATLWAAQIASFWIGSLRFRMIIERLDVAVGTTAVFLASAVTGLYGMVLPGMISTGVKWHLLRRVSGDGAAVLATMAYNQLHIILSAILIGSVAAVAADLPGALPSIWFVAVATMLVLAAATVASAGRLARPAGRLLLRLPDPAADAARRWHQHLRRIPEYGLGFHIRVASLSLLASLLGGVGLFALATRAAHTQAPLAVLAFLWAVVFLLGRLPISIANLGVREVTVVGLLGLYGVAAPTALLVSFLVFSGTVLIALIGAVWQVVRP